MEMEKLEKRMIDWATALGYTLPDGSAVPPNFFSLLIMTPHRRELWEELIESVQPRKKVELMRKQLLVLSLRESNRNPKHFDSKQLESRVHLWRRQALLEKELQEKKSFILETEKTHIAKACALLFEIWKIAELEKQCEEYKEKTLVIYLLARKEKILMERLEKMLIRVVEAFDPQASLSNLREELKGMQCMGPGLCHSCDFMNKLMELCMSGAGEKRLWEEAMKCKESLLNELLELLEELKTGKKIKLREKESEVAESLRFALTQLKQKIAEKSLEVLVNKTDGQLLRAEIADLEEKMEGLFEEEENGSLNDSISFGMSETGREEALAKVEDLMKSIGLSCYEEFLRSEVARAEDEVRKEKQWEAKTRGEREYQRSLDSIESVANEIHLLVKESGESKREIAVRRDRLRTLADNSKNDDVYGREENAEGPVARLKVAVESQIQLLMETPAEAFSEMGCPTGEKSLEWGSMDRDSGARFRRFFSAVLLPPFQDARSILEEVERRKKLTEDAKKFISERMRLSTSQALLLSQATSATQVDFLPCEKNFKESEAVLGKIMLRSDDLRSRIAFAEKILKNWLEQPYKRMVNVTEMVEGQTARSD